MFVQLLPINPFIFFFFNDTATTEIYTLSLHDALPISYRALSTAAGDSERVQPGTRSQPGPALDRKSTRLNSSHDQISYAVFCLKKNKVSNPQIIVDTQPSMQKLGVALSIILTIVCAAA